MVMIFCNNFVMNFQTKTTLIWVCEQLESFFLNVRRLYDELSSQNSLGFGFVNDLKVK
jgi:hypothetical protein